MKLLTVEDYEKAGESFWLSIGTLPKNLVRVPEQKIF